MYALYGLMAVIILGILIFLVISMVKWDTSNQHLKEYYEEEFKGMNTETVLMYSERNVN